jgi:hypothetical protein
MSPEEEKLQKPDLIQLRCPEVNHNDNCWPSTQDLLGRDKEIENLSPVLLNVQAPLVFAIDAPWGAGKTTFIKLWQQYLEHNEQVSLYLNAWENDFSDDPLLPLMSVMDDWLSSNSEKTVTNEAWEKAKKYAPGVLKATAVATAKAATFGVLDVEKEYEKLASDLAGGAVESLVDSFNVQKKALEQFKVLIAEAIQALPDGQQNLIIFIDELDRCKPTFSIEMLERIKHLFDIERLVFVLALNRDQLSKSLQGVYGSSFDGGHYLKRFIDLDYRLRIPDLKTYTESRINQEDIKKYFNSRKDGADTKSTFLKILNYLFERFDYKLRDVDQLVSRLRLILKSIPETHDFDVVIFTVLLILREKNLNLYEQYIQDINFANDVLEFLFGIIMDNEKVFDRYGWIGGWLICVANDDYNEPDLSALIDPWIKLRESLDKKSGKYKQVETLIRLASDRSFYGRGDIRKLAFDRIELLSQISLDIHREESGE